MLGDIRQLAEVVVGVVAAEVVVVGADVLATMVASPGKD